MMKNILLLMICLLSTSVWGQQTIPQSIFLRSNGINSTELLMYKEDNTTYYSLYSNHGGFGIYDSNAAAIRFFINSSGNVGIGTGTPTEKLSVKGKIRAQEIKVEAINWPDYVFAKNYQLPSLQETENHIKEKGHLPGIPSADEVKANGVDLGEMNAKLLKKIEELTLYLIEMKKDNELEKINNLEQKKIIYQQQKDIKYLKSKIK